MEAPPDWDLLAVVRSCCTTTTTTTTTATTTTTTATTTSSEAAHLGPYQPPQQQQQQQQQEPCFSPTTTSVSTASDVLFRFPTPFDTPTTSFLGSHQELQDICKPLICTPTTTSSNNINNNTSFQAVSSPSPSPSLSLSSPVSSSSNSYIPGRSFRVAEQPQLRRLIKPTQVIFGAAPSIATASNASATTSQGQRTKKRKNLMKKVCHVPAEGLSSDMWAWRKYGQKPIKGSPYPRGYYRCSSSKGCLARKQVERNRSDPKMFIVTYTAEHNHPMPTHRNSLAGSTRQKPSGETTGAAATPPEQPSCSSPSGASLSPLTEKSESKTEKEDNEEADNEMGLSDLMLNDDFYVGFEQIDGDDGSDSFSDQFSPTMEFPWLANNSNSSTATAAGGS